MSRRVLVWGNGSVGSGLALILSENCEVTLLGPPGCAAGTLFLRSEGAMACSAAVQQLPADSPPSGDYSVIAVKAGDLSSLAVLMGSGRTSAGGSFLPALCITNGMGLESAWGSGWERDIEPAVLTAGFRLLDGGVVKISPGRIIVEENGIGDILFSSTSLETAATDRMEIVRWAKWLANSVINPIGALSGLRNNQLKGAGLQPLMESLTDELLSVVPSGMKQEVRDLAGEMLEFLLSRSDNYCSMLQDVQSGRETEIDYLTGLCRGSHPSSCRVASALVSLVRARVLELHDAPGDSQFPGS